MKLCQTVFLDLLPTQKQVLELKSIKELSCYRLDVIEQCWT